MSQWLRTHVPQKRTIDDSIVAYGDRNTLTNNNFDLLKDAHNDARMYLQAANNYLTQQSIPLYNVWFGSVSNTRFTTVEDNFQETYSETSKTHVYNFLPANMCPANWLAHVDKVLLGKKQHVINICPLFFTSTDKVVTLVHEMTHDTSATQDLCYGQKECKNLAKNNADLAVDSAENYALFAKDAYLQLRGSEPPNKKSCLLYTSDAADE